MRETWRVFSKLILLVILCLAVGQVGVFYTTAEEYNWYSALNKPDWSISALWFPLAWTAMYILMAFSAWDVWKRKNKGYIGALGIWILQLILNGLWVPLFFGYHKLTLASLLMLGLFIILCVNIILFYKQSKTAGNILLVYFIWIIYINIINFMIWQMN